MRTCNVEGDGQDVKMLAALTAGVGANVSEYAIAIAATRAPGGASTSILFAKEAVVSAVASLGVGHRWGPGVVESASLAAAAAVAREKGVGLDVLRLVEDVCSRDQIPRHTRDNLSARFTSTMMPGSSELTGTGFAKLLAYVGVCSASRPLELEVGLGTPTAAARAISTAGLAELRGRRAALALAGHWLPLAERWQPRGYTRKCL